MGVDKARLPLRGAPLAEHVAGVLLEGGCEAVWLVRRGGPDGLPWRLPVVRETEDLPRHVLTGFVSALDAAPGLVLVAACDLFDLAPEQVRAVREAGPCVARSTQGAAVLALLEQGDRAGLVACVRAGASFRAWASGRTEVAVGDLRNANRWEDLGMPHPIERLGRALGLSGSALQRAEQGERARLAARGCLLP